jgi:hypothetical protein
MTVIVQVQNIENQLLQLLESMSEVSVENGGNTGAKFLIKNAIKFGIIKDGVIFFKDQHGMLIRVTEEVFNDIDKFLELATQAYWIASEKMQK